MKLRLIQVVCTPQLVIEDDDGEFIGTVATEPVMVPAKQWPTYATEEFPTHIADFERTYLTQRAEQQKLEQAAASNGSGD